MTSRDGIPGQAPIEIRPFLRMSTDVNTNQPSATGQPSIRLRVGIGVAAFIALSATAVLLAGHGRSGRQPTSDPNAMKSGWEIAWQQQTVKRTSVQTGCDLYSSWGRCVGPKMEWVETPGPAVTRRDHVCAGTREE